VPATVPPMWDDGATHQLTLETTTYADRNTSTTAALPVKLRRAIKKSELKQRGNTAAPNNHVGGYNIHSLGNWDHAEISTLATTLQMRGTC
jgi:hypothetical protein